MYNPGYKSPSFIRTLSIAATNSSSQILNQNATKTLDHLPPHPTKSVAGLCDFNDWTEKPAFSYLFLPFGMAILLVRLLVLVSFGLIIMPFSRDTKCRALKVVLRLIGIQINRNMTHKQLAQHTKGAVVAINHVSVFDSFLSLIHPNATIMLVRTPGSVSKLIISFLMNVSGVRCWRVTDKRQLAKYFMQWRKSPEQNSLCVTPEATVNNGRGLFSFRSDFLSRGFPVVPASVSIKTPFGICAHPAQASASRKFLRLAMMPWIKFDMVYLDKKTRTQGQSKEAFAEEIQKEIANHLGIPATKWTAKQKHDYISSFKMSKKQ